MVHDIKYLLSDNESEEENEKAVYLWDNMKERVSNGKQYRENGVKEDGSDNDE